MASSSIVIKVKFGETLRRFTASINDKKLVLDIVMLKEKIRSLFSFDSSVDFILTYVDEDGDSVTLADNDDLHDVVRQSLNPLRITVNLNNSNHGGPSQNSAPLNQTLNPRVPEILKSVPEPLRDVLAKLPLDLASRASASAPAVAELVERMKTVYLNQISASMASPRVNPPTSGAPNVNRGPSTVNDSKVQVNPRVQRLSEGVDLNLPYFQNEFFQAPTNAIGKNKNPTDDVSNGSLNEPLLKPAGFANDSGSTSGWAQGILNATNECPFAGMQLPSDSDSHGHHRRSHSRGPHWKRFSLDNNGVGSIIHRGVRCDGCGVHPITGPRFKSKVKDDYDLCSLCFAGMGNMTDYMRIDRPTNGYRHHMHFKGFPDSSYRIPPPTLPHAMRAPGSKLPRSKLDSRFILDVNVLDGTIMAPFTAFTKIWRMRNNGSIVWPHGSQLQWIGGDRLSISHSVDVEIPVDGLPVDKELDVAVDFSAPELPGRYVSYWRMASPSGQKFGQRVWVLIQVDASMKDLGETSINLNLPPVIRNHEAVNQDPPIDNTLSGNNIIKVTGSENTSPKDHDMNFPINDSLIIDNGGLSAPTGPAISSVSLGFYPNIELDIDSLEPVSYSTVDFSVMPPVITGSGAPSPTVTAAQPSFSVSQEVGDDQEQALVKDLEDMGFKQMDLNKEILRRNNYDLEKSIDDLCGVSEWDPMLDELQEMGFEDNEANRRLLKKNNGSIKRVVMDLINGEKP